MDSLGAATTLGDFDDPRQTPKARPPRSWRCRPRRSTIPRWSDPSSDCSGRGDTSSRRAARRPAQTRAAVETVRPVGDALLIAAGLPEPDQPATRSHWVEVTATRRNR